MLFLNETIKINLLTYIEQHSKTKSSKRKKDGDPRLKLCRTSLKSTTNAS
uniref:Uncharacterized protein n=1 Tax=Tetranychus urticae TaxID=32264 RepID=T1KQI2_TETUR